MVVQRHNDKDSEAVARHAKAIKGRSGSDGWTLDDAIFLAIVKHGRKDLRRNLDRENHWFSRRTTDLGITMGRMPKCGGGQGRPRAASVRA
jgi:hypothetical protein